MSTFKAKLRLEQAKQRLRNAGFTEVCSITSDSLQAKERGRYGTLFTCGDSKFYLNDETIALLLS